MHWTTTDSFEYCPQPSLHLSVFILIVPLLCLLDLPSASCHDCATLLLFFAVCDSFLSSWHFCSRSNNYSHYSNPSFILVLRGELLSFHKPLICLRLFVASGSNVAAQTASVFLCRKLVCRQDAWVLILNEYWMNVCRVTCIIHVLFLFLYFITFHFWLFTPPAWGPTIQWHRYSADTRRFVLLFLLFGWSNQI